MASIKLALILSTILIEFIYADFPPDIQRCALSDENCFIDTTTKLLTKHPNGYEPIGLPSLEPLRISEIRIEQGGNTSVTFALKLTDVKGYGFSNFQLKKTIGFGNGKVCEVYGLVPSLNFIGKYEVNGNILVLPINGHGDTTLSLQNITLGIKAKQVFVEKNGQKYLQFEKLKSIIKPTSIHYNMTNLFNGDPVLGEAMLTLLNENADLVWEESQASFSNSVSPFLKNLINEVLAKFPYSELFLLK